jgi:hypothetical protein
VKRRPKTGRTQRGRRRAAAVSERDLSTLEFLAAARYATAPQAALAIGMPVDRARRVLRRLFSGRLTDVRLVAAAQPSLHSLSREGAALLQRERQGSPARLRPPAAIRLADVQRHLLLTDLRLWAAELLSSRGTPMLRWSAGSTPDRRHGLAGLEPDALIEMSTPAGSAVIAVEADAGAASSDSVLRRIGRYAAVAAAGKVDALWIASSGNRTRVLAIERRIEEAGLSRWARVLPREALLRRPAALPPRADAAAGGLEESERKPSPAPDEGGE